MTSMTVKLVAAAMALWLSLSPSSFAFANEEGSFLSPAKNIDPFSTYFKKVAEASLWLKERTGASPKLIITLTGGMELPEDTLSEKQEVSSAEIPFFPVAKVQGHAGRLIFGKLQGQDVVILKGRYHYYEGLSPQEVVFPYFVLGAMGAKVLITTNAVGGIRQDLEAGDIMLVMDHINAMGDSPLRGIAVQRPGKQFTDMTRAYAPLLREIAKDAAGKLDIVLKEGVYLGTAGPNYETKSEIKAFRAWGGDAVGMSTIFEVIACNFLDIKVLAFCGIANPAADRVEGGMDHDEVLVTMSAMGPKLVALLFSCAEQIIQNLESEEGA